MTFPVFKDLGTLRGQLSDRLGYSNQGSASGVLKGNLDNILQMSQFQLYWMFDWRYLLKTHDQPTGVGQRFYGIPSDMDPMQLQNVVSEELDGQGVDHIVNGDVPHNILGWTDSSNGTGTISWNALGYLDLNDTAAGEGIADQQQSGLDANQNYTLGFEVKDYGANGPLIKIGTALGLSDIFLSTDSYPVGSHTLEFLTTVANPFLRFEASVANTNDTVSLKNITLRKTDLGPTNGKIWPMYEGVDWQHDSYRHDNQRPRRYEIRDQIEIWPPADSTKYVIRYEYIRKLGDFNIDTDRATINDNVLFLHALATAKGHYGQKDFNLILAQSERMINNLRGKNFGERRYVRNNPNVERYSLHDDDDYCRLVHKNVLDL